MAQTQYTKLQWDLGTAYDLFISLMILHDPEPFGLRASWAAGVRSRMPVKQRQTLETVNDLMYAPLFFAYETKKPKDAAALIEKLANIPDEKRFEAIFFRNNTPEGYREILLNTRQGKKWTPAERKYLIENRMSYFPALNAASMELLHAVWADREQFGRDYLNAIQAYAESFFFEEEQRISPVLRKGISHAQMRAGTLPLTSMLEELSGGVRFTQVDKYANVILAPTFWGAPFLYYEYLNKDTLLMLYGSRPETMSLVPGVIVPEALLLGLKALGDPSRLRILRTLAATPLTAAQLSRSLRLRPSTVTHHLRELRIAGMVQVIVSSEGDRQYATRHEGFDINQDLLNNFIHGE